MTALAAGIASLGLILNSPAVIIGAMLVAPLMAAIIGMGLGISQGDARLLMNSAGATLRGALVALGMGLLLGLFYLDRDPTQEMLSRTAPSLLDLMVAMISGFAAAYALCQKNLSNALPGVAIAVALVPPLATTGLLMSMMEWTRAAGALLLFLTNLIAITFASTIVFISLGFHPPLARVGRRHQIFQRHFLASGLLVLVLLVILVELSREEIIESRLENEVEDVLTQHFSQTNASAALSQWSIPSYDETGVKVEVLVRATQRVSRAEALKLRDQLAQRLGQPVSLVMSVVPAWEIPAKGKGVSVN